MRRITGKKIQSISSEDLLDLAEAYSSVAFDLGTGDGKFAYKLAAEQPQTLVVAVDADKSQMEKLSHKASRKPEKGGLGNLIFIWSAVEQLPSDQLKSIADKAYVNFPWGSLLAGIIKAEPEFLRVIGDLVKPSGELEILTSYDEKFEPETIAKYRLPELNQAYIEGSLASAYSNSGMNLNAWSKLPEQYKSQLHGTWPKRLHGSRNSREVISIIFTRS